VNTIIFENKVKTAEAVAAKIIEVVLAKPEATLVVTSGDTPTLAYEILCQTAPKNLFEKAHLISLDEWVGVSRNTEGGCSFMVDNTLFQPLGLSESQFSFFEATAPDLAAECQRIDKIIFERGGLDFVLVGLGLNAHIGLNEPGSSFDSYCQVTKLEPLTATVGQKYFKTQTQLTEGITVGLKHMLEAKEVIIMATGSSKAEVIQKISKSEPTEALPATFIHLHSNGHFYLDKDAAALID
jgi:6-phosphogluconolactonase/glucosamine-6-phosphate isomerase/deaminase